MQTVREGGSIVLRLSSEETMRLCKPGGGKDTCIWLMSGPNGFDCHYFCRPKGLTSRWVQGLTVAQRNGCDEVKSLDFEKEYVDAPSLADMMNSEG